MVSTGADGLVKLWGVRSAECAATFDEHDGKVHVLSSKAHDPVCSTCLCIALPEALQSMW